MNRTLRKQLLTASSILPGAILEQAFSLSQMPTPVENWLQNNHKLLPLCRMNLRQVGTKTDHKSIMSKPLEVS